MFKTFLNWLVFSSQDPEKVGMTVTGLITGASSFIIWLAYVSPAHIVIGVDVVSQNAIIFGGAAASLLTFVGFIRKFLAMLKPYLKAVPPSSS